MQKQLSPAQLAQRIANGYATLMRHGKDHYRAMGKKGGRPTFAQSVDKARQREEHTRRVSRQASRRAKSRDPGKGG